LSLLVNTLKRLRANVTGVVLNEITRDVGDSYYYHGTQLSCRSTAE
jgi:Mrp family chromosome partitioning ATPase